MSSAYDERANRRGRSATLVFATVKQVLEDTRNCTAAATILGVTLPVLSRYLHADCRIDWWRATKKRWRREWAAERLRRKRRARALRAEGLMPPPDPLRVEQGEMGRRAPQPRARRK